MKYLTFRIMAIVATCVLSVAPLALAHDHDVEDVDYPEHFRTFTHVTTGIVTPGFIFNGVDLGAIVPGLHNIYANKKAMRGYRDLESHDKMVFMNGSVIAFDLWETGTLTSGSGSFTFQKARLAVAVMEKDERKYASTGGWGFQVFDPVSKKALLNADQQARCFACHKITPETDFVFSKFSD